MIEKLNWDSKFFGYPIGKLSLKEVRTIDQLFFFDEWKSFKLLYIYSDIALPKKYNIELVDQKVDFAKQMQNCFKASNLIEFSHDYHSYEELLDLVLLSGLYSRFNLDKNFCNNEFYNLYKKWIDNSLLDKNVKVLVEIRKGRLAGFITVVTNLEKNARIGLIAVNSCYKGHGIGSLLLNGAENEAIKKGDSVMKVATQLSNKPAIHLYEKNNYKKSSITYIYHLWNR